MRRLLFVLTVALCVLGLGVAALVVVFRPERAVRVANGLVRHTLCGETFVANAASR